EEFCLTARMLTERVGLQDQVSFCQGSALNMPFADSTFDVVWTQFVGMNIGDKVRLYSEGRRVIRNGGYFAFHEVMAANLADIYYPFLWANDPSISFLKKRDEIRRSLSDDDFKEIVWRNLSQSAAEAFKTILAAPPPPNQMRLGLNVFVLDNVTEKMTN